MFEKFRVTRHERRLNPVLLLMASSTQKVLWKGNDMPTEDIIQTLREHAPPAGISDMSIFGGDGLEFGPTFSETSGVFEIRRRVAGLLYSTVAISPVEQPGAAIPSPSEVTSL